MLLETFGLLFISTDGHTVTHNHCLKLNDTCPLGSRDALSPAMYEKWMDSVIHLPIWENITPFKVTPLVGSCAPFNKRERGR